MALLFLNEPSEATCFTTRGNESRILWMADDALHSGVLGLRGRISPVSADTTSNEKMLYIGHGDKHTGTIEKIIVIDHDAIKILRHPDQSAPKNLEFPEALWTIRDHWDANSIRPVVSLQDTFHLYANGSLTQSGEARFKDRVEMLSGMMVVSGTGTQTRFQCDSNAIQMESDFIALRASKGISIVADECRMEVPKINCMNDVCIHGNLRVEDTGCLNANAIEATTVVVKDTLKSPVVFTDHLKVQESLTVHQGICVGASNAVYMDIGAQRVSIAPPVELKQNLCLGAEASLVADGIVIGPVGTITSQGTLSLNAPNATHVISGNTEIHGRTTMKGETVIGNRCKIARDTVIGEPYSPASLCVYGVSHLSQPFYCHDRAYFDRDVVVQGNLKVLSGKTGADKVIEVPKGTVEIQQGALWIRGASGSQPTLKIAEGSTVLEGGLTAGATAVASLTVAGTSVFKATECSRLMVAEDLKTPQLNVANVFQTTPDGVLFSPDVSLDIPKGTLRIGGDIQCQSVSVNDTMRIHCGLHIETGTPQEGAPLRLRHRRYGLYEPIATKPRVFQFMRMPYGRGCATFNIRIQGSCWTPTGGKNIDIELGGTPQNPTTKRATVCGNLMTFDGYSAEQAFKVVFCRHLETKDYYGFIELHRRFAVGFEIQIECPAYRDIFEWKPLETTTGMVNEPTLERWWSPLDYPEESRSANTVSWMAKTGIGEPQPLYALDVRGEARFQSKVYQPLSQGLAEAIGVPVVFHGDQSYVAMGDVLEALIKSCVKNRDS